MKPSGEKQKLQVIKQPGDPDLEKKTKAVSMDMLHPVPLGAERRQWERTRSPSPLCFAEVGTGSELGNFQRFSSSVTYDFLRVSADDIPGELLESLWSRSQVK